MMLSGRNEWIAIGALILFIAFVPTPYPLKEALSSSIGKAAALAGIVYVWKYVSCPVAVLLLVAFLRAGSIREYLDETGVTPSAATISANEYSCPSGFTYDSTVMLCKKGNETKEPTCKTGGMVWDVSVGKCVTAPTTGGSSAASAATGSGGPAGGSTPGGAAAMNDALNSITVQKFTNKTEGFEANTPGGMANYASV